MPRHNPSTAPTSTPSSSSPVSLPSSLLTLDDLADQAAADQSSINAWGSLDDILERITVAKEAVKAWEATLKAALADLDSLVDAGVINPDEPLIWNDYKLTSSTRKSYAYPEHIIQQQTALKAAQELAVALGEAETKLTTYWTIRSL